MLVQDIFLPFDKSTDKWDERAGTLQRTTPDDSALVRMTAAHCMKSAAADCFKNQMAVRYGRKDLISRVW